MKAIMVVKAWVSKDANPAVSIGEFKKFWDACNEQERKAFAITAAREMGVELDES